MTALAVEAKGLVRRFGSFTAVDGIDLAVPWGTIYGFLGANGAGKTTVIRMLCGLLAPTSGSAMVADLDVVSNPDGVKAHIGYMAQKFSLYGDLSVEENIRFFADIYLVPRSEVGERVDEVLAATTLTDRRSRPTASLPVGIKQRLALACALIHRPRVLFLDEPTAGVDPLSRRAFWRQIHKLRVQGVTTFVTTHHLDEAENCQTVLFMQAGKAVGGGAPSQLRRDAERGDLFRIRGVDRAALRADPRVIDATPMGDAWHSRLRSPQDADGLARDLGCTLTPVAPSLEDVFLEACKRAS